MERITNRHLDVRLAYLNDLLGVGAATPGVYDPAPGRHYIGSQLGGYRVEAFCTGGGSRDVQPRRGTRRQAFDFLGAMIAGIEASRAGHGEQA